MKYQMWISYLSQSTSQFIQNQCENVKRHFLLLIQNTSSCFLQHLNTWKPIISSLIFIAPLLLILQIAGTKNIFVCGNQCSKTKNYSWMVDSSINVLYYPLYTKVVFIKVFIIIVIYFVGMATYIYSLFVYTNIRNESSALYFIFPN